ncbi:hypothetical protein FACS1894201_11390 [Bacteroidia bacterium]|nr:hypothetical protein FACS1894201_11390 [Bacteroidia bacterium]
MKNLYIIFFVLLTIQIGAQPLDSTFATRIDQNIQKMIEENCSAPYSLVMDVQSNIAPDSLIYFLSRYDTIQNADVQEFLYECYYEYVWKKVVDTAFKKQMITYFLNGCNAVNPTSACRYATECMKQLDNSLFEKIHIDTINVRASKLTNVSLDYAYLSGKLYQRQMIPVFKQQLKEAKWDGEKYKLGLILARLGDEEGLAIVQKSLQELPIFDRIFTIDGVIKYVKQKQIIDVLLDDLHANDFLPSQYPSDNPPLYAQLALHKLTTLIYDFPIKRNLDGYTDEELEIARKWAKKHKKNYQIIEE